MKPRKITCSMAAKLMGVTNMFLAVQLRNKNKAFPFGVAMPPERGAANWNYYIIPAKFAEFMGWSEEDLWKRIEEASQNAS